MAKYADINLYLEDGWTVEKIMATITARPIAEYHIFLHDKDLTDDGALKKAHYHTFIRPNSDQTFDTIAKWFGLEKTELVQKIKGQWQSAILYGTHKNAPDKYQYDVSACVASSDIKWVKSINENYVQFQSKKARKERENQILLDIVEGRILPGEVKDESKITALEYINLKPKIDRALELYYKRQREDDRDMEVIYISGKSGTGKTSYAKHYANCLELEYYVAGGGEFPFDDYDGQPVVILDDARGSNMTFNEFLKLTDNNTLSTVRARYHNKNFAPVKYIIITSTEEPTTFYSGMFQSDGEEKKQFARRVKTYVHMEMDYITFLEYKAFPDKSWAYVPATHKGVPIPTQPNPFSEEARGMASDTKKDKLLESLLTACTFGVEVAKKEIEERSTSALGSVEVPAPDDIYDIFPPKQLEIE